MIIQGLTLLEKVIDEKILEETIKETGTFIGKIFSFVTDVNNYIILSNILLKAFLVVLLSRIFLFVGQKFLANMVIKNPDSRRHKTLSAVFGSAFKAIVSFFTLVGLLEIIGVPTTAIVAVAGVGSVAIGFGAQYLVSDVITGLFAIVEDYYGVDDVIKVKEITGKVELVGIRSISIRSANGDLHIIPHGQIQMVTNLSRDYKRAVIDLHLPYDSNADAVIEALRKEMALYDGGDKVLGSPEVVGIINFGESGYVVRILCDCIIGQHWSVERDFRLIILRFLERENLEIPYTTRAIEISYAADDFRKQ